MTTQTIQHRSTQRLENAAGACWFGSSTFYFASGWETENPLRMACGAVQAAADVILMRYGDKGVLAHAVLTEVAASAYAASGGIRFVSGLQQGNGGEVVKGGVELATGLFVMGGFALRILERLPEPVKRALPRPIVNNTRRIARPLLNAGSFTSLATGFVQMNPLLTVGALCRITGNEITSRVRQQKLEAIQAVHSR